MPMSPFGSWMVHIAIGCINLLMTLSAQNLTNEMESVTLRLRLRHRDQAYGVM